VPVAISIGGAAPSSKVYLTWTPVAATAKATGGASNVVLRNAAGAQGQVLFSATRTGAGAASMALTLPADGSPIGFWVAGSFGSPSRADQDGTIEAVDSQTSAILGSQTVMVRIRKNATTLTDPERDRFVAALGTLNGRGAGKYADLRAMHVAAAYPEEHGDVQFLPWHRAYLLDLERELQAIDASVTIPYWRFDQPAPNIFTAAFMGDTSNPLGRVRFVPGHPLQFWATDNQSGITRAFSTFSSSTAPRLRSETQTLNLGASAQFADFRVMEGDPHGLAHTGFNGFLQSIPTAPRDPLFFMLHANVDRLWAKWQWFYKRTDPALAASFAPAVTPRIGRSLGDTMWPWNRDMHSPRPSFAPGGPMPASPSTTAPGGAPRIEDMIDFQGVGGGAQLAFDYDDVPFQAAPPVVAGGP
jgi:tyrosinase